MIGASPLSRNPRDRSPERLLMLLAILGCSAPSEDPALPSVPFVLSEATVASIHAAFTSGELTCQGLVRSYLDRIEVYDDQGPELRAILSVNPRALETARDGS